MSESVELGKYIVWSHMFVDEMLMYVSPCIVLRRRTGWRAWLFGHLQLLLEDGSVINVRKSVYRYLFGVDRIMMYVTRHDMYVWESDFEPIRNGNCMCHFCARYKPGNPDNCMIAQKFFEICKESGCAFILTRCGSWCKRETSCERR